MIIHGLQKLTLLDYPGKTACTIFLGNCNFRCPYCHNQDLVLTPFNMNPISEDTLFAFLKKRQGLLDGVCITGGEPLLHGDLLPLLSSIRDLGFSIKLDTNGSFPDRLEKYVRLGLLDYVAMDIKNSIHQYQKTTACTSIDLSSINKSVQFLLSGKIEYEFRTTMVKEFHEEKDFLSIGQWISGAKRYFLQKFVDSGHLVGSAFYPTPHFHAFSQKEASQIQTSLLPFVPFTKLRGYDI